MNSKMLDEQIPAYHIAKRARLDQLAHEAQTEERYALEMLMYGVVFLILFTAALLVLSVEQGWW